MKGSVLGFDNSRNIVLSNWRQPLVKRASCPENVGGDGSWPDWDIKMAGELTPSVRLRIAARFLMRCLLNYQEAPRASIFIYMIFLPRINTDGHGSTQRGIAATTILDCGGKRSATPLSIARSAREKRCRRCALPPQSKIFAAVARSFILGLRIEKSSV
jgi:hypothetical protein